ncbi:hypothetical protein [Kitasatospora sp. HPMI-4]|uniref:hypothetical protein n=1 Tax=Kitasatospora sp. HPMI-4 TaxID=3448443 RepID=UPI003F1CD686
MTDPAKLVERDSLFTADDEEFVFGAGGCQCPQRRQGGCVESLGTLMIGKLVTDHQRRVGKLIGIRRATDPVTGVIRATIILLRSVSKSTGRNTTWAIRCAGVAPMKPNRRPGGRPANGEGEERS